MLSLVLATRNPHKVAEVGRMLAGAGIGVEPLPDGIDLPPEVGSTYAANAMPKARCAAAATGRVSIGDDSGIEAQALGGRPGVQSARYAGPRAGDEENLARFIREVPPGDRLCYVCVIALVDPSARVEMTFVGRCLGHMAEGPRGAGGFGYDPIFLPADVPDGRTMAELSDDEKDAISHRGRALEPLVSHLTGRTSPLP